MYVDSDKKIHGCFTAEALKNKQQVNPNSSIRNRLIQKNDESKSQTLPASAGLRDRRVVAVG